MRLTIVTNALNQGAFLPRAMASVLGQGGPDLDYIVVDPGSTDATPEILAAWEARGDPRLRVLRGPDAGPADGLNRAFAEARGDWLAYLNADDFYLPGALAAAAQAVARHPADCVYGDGYLADAAGRPIRRVISTPFSARAFVWGRTLVLQQACFWRAESFRAVGGFNAANRTSWDAELLLEMALAGMRLTHVPGYWAAFTLHPGSITGSQRLAAESAATHARLFARVMGRARTPRDLGRQRLHRLAARALRPRATLLRGLDALAPPRMEGPMESLP